MNLEDAELIAAAVLHKVDHTTHISIFPERAQLWEKLKVSDLLVTLCKCLKKVYLSIYTDCGRSRNWRSSNPVNEAIPRKIFILQINRVLFCNLIYTFSLLCMKFVQLDIHSLISSSFRLTFRVGCR